MIMDEKSADRKFRWAGLLEHPVISKIQRDLLDSGRGRAVAGILKELPFKDLLDVGCGLGETARLCPAPYYGLDNSFSRVHYAKRHYCKTVFIAGDALRLPFKDGRFDMVMMTDTAHHLTEEEFQACFREMCRVSRKWVMVSDPVLTPGQGRLSSFFYSLDRGACFRAAGDIEELALQAASGIRLARRSSHRSFPGLYFRTVLVFEKQEAFPI